jgi:hypothetical protein
MPKKKKTKLSKKMPSSLEKTITLTSLGAILVSFFIGFKGLTGNVIIQNNSNQFLGFGAVLFVLGVLGVFLANRK